MTCFLVKYSVIFEKARFRNFDNLSNMLRLNCVNLIPNYTLWEAKLTQKMEKRTLPILLLVVTHMNFNIISYYYFFTSSFMCVWWFYCIILPVLKNKVTIFALECKKNRGDTWPLDNIKKQEDLISTHTLLNVTLFSSHFFFFSPILLSSIWTPHANNNKRFTALMCNVRHEIWSS